MPSGRLQDVLNEMAIGNLTLSWPERHRLLCSVAQGLAYLHNESLGSSIVHHDLKPGNILLDESYKATLGDFGLAARLRLWILRGAANRLPGFVDLAPRLDTLGDPRAFVVGHSRLGPLPLPPLLNARHPQLRPNSRF
jgi:serine/threonine protein kinase